MKLSILFLTILMAAVTGCHDDHDHPTTAPTTAPVSAAHDGHDHQHHHHGDAPKAMLGLVEAEGFEVSAVQNGKLIPGAELNFDIEILGKSKPRSVRFWIGGDTAEATRKKAAEEVKDNVYHVDLDLDGELQPGSRLWVEIDRDSGNPVRVSFELNKS